MDGKELQRIRKGLSPLVNQADFGWLVGVTRQAVSEWERGVMPVDGSVAVLARVLNAYPELLPEMLTWARDRPAGGVRVPEGTAMLLRVLGAYPELLPQVLHWAGVGPRPGGKVVLAAVA